MNSIIVFHEIHTMKINTIPGAHYALTCTTECTVKAIRNDGKQPLSILEASYPGQFGFTAPTEAIEVSDEDAIVTQTFKGAALGLSAQDGGIKNGEDAFLKNLTAQAGTFFHTVNANGGINIPVAPSMDTEAARYKELRVVNEFANSAVKSFFKASNPFTWGTLVDRSSWLAQTTATAFTVAKCEFTLFSRDYLNNSYNVLTGCFIPLSCGIGRGWCFDSIAFGNTAFNEDYTNLNGEPFTTPDDYMRYWIEVRIGVPDNGQCAVSVRMSRWDRTTGTVVNSSNSLSIPQNFGLRGLAVDCYDNNSGVWLVGLDRNAWRLVSYKILPETFKVDSFQGIFSESKLSLAKASGVVEMGVNTPRYYGGTILREWCGMIQSN
ncbi:MAG: hypothetical protein LUE13_01760 [Akkermansiaceae bacterium]|nr:hypothetical protein [Akkermansiaceae bacterium]